VCQLLPQAQRHQATLSERTLTSATDACSSGCSQRRKDSTISGHASPTRFATRRELATDRRLLAHGLQPPPPERVRRTIGPTQEWPQAEHRHRTSAEDCALIVAGVAAG
jgi:hypothetical protein